MMFRTTLRTVLLLLFVLLAQFLFTPLFSGQTPSASAASSVTASSAPDFSFSVSPLSQSRKRGTGAPYDFNITDLNGFNASITFTITGSLPAGDIIEGGRVFTVPAGTTFSGFTVQLKKGSGRGTFPLTVTATSGSLTHQVNVSLTIL